jgi:hypothetical protein
MDVLSKHQTCSTCLCVMEGMAWQNGGRKVNVILC